ncbi:MAG: hypothetical protein ACT4PM_08090 [Gemmatimonadales bacterium]
MKPSRSHTLEHGAIAGLIAGAVVALWFLGADLMSGEPFRTPALLANVLVHRTGPAGFRLIAMYALLHFGIFALLGVAAAAMLRVLSLAPSLLLGVLFGIGVFDSVHYGALLLTGTGVLSVLPPLQVLPANLLGGLAMMAYLHRATRAETPLGLAVLREYPLWTKGIVTGLVGAGTVALWFLVVDILRDRPFFTPAALGSLLFLGAASPGEVRVDPAIIGAYTLVHLVGFVFAGLLLEWIASRIERAPGMWLVTLLFFITLEALFIGTAAPTSGWVLGELGYWSIAIANLLAVGAMGWWVWTSHPRLRRELVEQPVQTRV